MTFQYNQMGKITKWWLFISYMGVDLDQHSSETRRIILINRTNFVLFFLMVVSTLVTTLVRYINNGLFTIHTQKLLIMMVVCLVNMPLLYKKRHELVAFILVILPCIVMIYLPFFFGAFETSDPIFVPLFIITFSIVAHILYRSRISSWIFMSAMVFFFIQLLVFDYIIYYFSGFDFASFLNDPTFYIYYKIILTASFVFIHSIIIYLHTLNSRFESELVNQNIELKSAFMELKSSQEKLLKAEKMASLGVLTAGVAHEINNPLNYIANGVMAIETVLRDKYEKDMPELEPLMDAVNQGVLRVSDIIKGLNGYARSESVPHSACDVHGVFEGALSVLKNQFSHRIEIVKKYNAKNSVVIANEGQLRQALLNILVNALHAIDKKGVIILETESDTERLTISISDSGCGIPQSIMKNIFDPFYTTKEAGFGSGLGLSICHKIITDHGGTITCQSVVNEGTTFTIVLPLYLGQ